MNDEIRRYAERFLATHYSDLDVRVGGASFDASRGVTLRDVVISQKHADGAIAPLLRVEKLQLIGQFDAENLVTGKPRIDEIVFTRPKLWATINGRGEWNIAQLLPPPPAGVSPADIRIDAAIVVVTTNDATKLPFLIDGVNATATQRIDGRLSPIIRVHIEQQSSRAESVVADVDFDTRDSRLTGDLAVTGLRVDTELLATLPGITADHLRGIDCSGRAGLTAKFTKLVGQPLDWQVDYKIVDARIAVERLPRQFTQIALDGKVTPETISVTTASARFGRAQFFAACNGNGWQSGGEFALQCRARDLPVDSTLHDVLPRRSQRLWARFLPHGVVDVDCALRMNAEGIRPERVAVTCRDASFEDHEKFPYRVEQAAGRLVYSIAAGEGRLEIALDGMAVNRPVSIRGELGELPCFCQFCDDGLDDGLVGGPLPSMPAGWIRIACEQIPIHERLLAALPDRAEQTVRSLDPHGPISVVWQIERSRELGAPPHTTTDLELHDCEVRYEKFPYPLSHITGKLHESDGEWTVTNVVSQPTAQGGSINCQGRCTTNDQGLALQLEFAGDNLPLDDHLRVALPDHLQLAWKQFRPSGRVNFRASVAYATGQSQPDVSLAVQPAERSCSIRPDFFDYSLEQLDGTIIYHQGVVSLRELRASHGRTTLATDGKWRRNELGGWRLDLSKLSVDRLTITRDLVLAAPQSLRQALEKVQPGGSFAIHDGTLAFTQPSEGSTQFASNWNLKLDCHQTDLDVGIELNDVSGMVHFVGESTPAGSYNNGQLMLDSAFWQGVQLTNIRGPIRAEKNRTLLGQSVSKVTGQTPARIEADISGGKLGLDAIVWHDGRTRYNLAASASGIDLGRLMHEQFHSTTELSGKVQGEITLGGVGPSVDLMQGSGSVKITEAKIYELPVLVSLLKVLRNRSPDTTAFDTCEANFEMSGKQIEFQQLNLVGDAVSLYGRGEANFDHEIDLVFHSIVGRHDWNVPMLRSFLGSASEQILQIEIEGTLEHPETRRRALPAVSSLIEQISNEGISPSNPDRAAARDNSPSTQPPTIPR